MHCNMESSGGCMELFSFEGYHADVADYLSTEFGWNTNKDLGT